MADNAKLIRTTTQRINEVPIANGQIIFTVDIPRVYMDFGGTRLPYTVVTLEDDEARLALKSPSKYCYYYTIKENVMWSYYSSWKQMTPSNLNPICFGTELPKEGNKDTLYVLDDAIYKYDPNSKEYHVSANKTAWNLI